jgi:hypothetical protein
MWGMLAPRAGIPHTPGGCARIGKVTGGDCPMIARVTALLGAAIAAALLALVVLGSAAAQGIGVAPAIIELEDALRGGEYTNLLTIFNQEERDLTAAVTGEGEVGQWASLRPLDDETATLDSIAVAANSQTRVVLRVTVPPDAPNGTHKGSIGLQTVAPEGGGDGGGTGATVGVSVALTVDVSGTQNLTGEVLDMSADDVEVGYPLRIQTTFHNTGNVKAQPDIRLQVKDSLGGVVAEAAYGDTVVDSGTTQAIWSEWDTTGAQTGDYVAGVSVLLGDQAIDIRDLPFKILPPGTLTRRGDLESLTLEGEPRANGVAKIIATFRNTGEIDTRATFLGEVYHKSVLIDSISSQELLVEPRQSIALDSFADVQEAGTYTVTGKVNYEGKETEEKELTFAVVSPGGGGDDGLPIWLWAVIGGAALMAAAVMVAGSWALARRFLRLFRV